MTDLKKLRATAVAKMDQQVAEMTALAREDPEGFRALIYMAYFRTVAGDPVASLACVGAQRILEALADQLDAEEAADA